MEIAQTMASFEMAALLLEGGKTVHPRRKFHPQINEDYIRNIIRQRSLAQLIQYVALFGWVETNMAHKHVAV